MKGETPARPGKASAFFLAARPKILTAALAPVAVGSAVAAAVGGFRALPAVAALLGAVAIQVGTNFANDVYDFERGSDDTKRVGPARAAQSGWLTPLQLKAGMAAAFAAAAVVGTYLTSEAGWPVVVIGVLSILAGLAYTAGPYPLGYNGLGDLFVMVFFGYAAVVGTTWVEALKIPPAAWAAAWPVGALATVILAVNNLRDLPGDRRSGKKTIPVLLGRGAGLREVDILLVSAYLVVSAMTIGGLSGPWTLLCWLSLPWAWKLRRRIGSAEDERSWNAALEGSARLLMLFSLLMAVGIAL